MLLGDTTVIQLKESSMLSVALVRWSVFLFTLPIRLVAGEDGHATAYNGGMKVVRAFGLLAFIAIVLAAIFGRG